MTGGLVFSWDQTGNANDTGSSLNLFNQGVFRNGTVNLTINTGTSVFKQNPFDLYIYATTPANNVSGEGTSITAGGETLYVRGNQNVNHSSFVEGDSVFLNAAQGSNYVKFEGVSGDSVTVTLSKFNNDSRVGLKGFQVVAIPEPGTLSLVLAALAGLMLYRRQG